MDRELIEMDIKNAIIKIVDTLENHNSDVWRPDGFLDSRIHDLIQDHITHAIHAIADELSYKFKIGNYSKREDLDDEESAWLSSV